MGLNCISPSYLGQPLKKFLEVLKVDQKPQPEPNLDAELKQFYKSCLQQNEPEIKNKRQHIAVKFSGLGDNFSASQMETARLAAGIMGQVMDEIEKLAKRTSNPLSDKVFTDATGQGLLALVTACIAEQSQAQPARSR